MRCLRPNPVVPPRFTTGYQLPSLRLEEIETACRKMHFIKLALMGREPPVAGHTAHAPEGRKNLATALLNALKPAAAAERSRSKAAAKDKTG